MSTLPSPARGEIWEYDEEETPATPEEDEKAWE